jgi:hypothetical protein
MSKNKDCDVNEIANIDQVTDQIIEILEYMSTDEMVELSKKDKNRFEYTLESKYDKFMVMYPHIFKLITRDDPESNKDDDLQKLFGVLTLLAEIKAGKKDFESTMEDFYEEQRQKYIYSKYAGGKVGFEKAMTDNAKKNEKK